MVLSVVVNPVRVFKNWLPLPHYNLATDHHGSADSAVFLRLGTAFGPCPFSFHNESFRFLVNNQCLDTKASRGARRILGRCKVVSVANIILIQKDPEVLDLCVSRSVSNADGAI
jgi:hypothetical protein